MKDLKNLGKVLSRNALKTIGGGEEIEKWCIRVPKHGRILEEPWCNPKPECKTSSCACP